MGPPWWGILALVFSTILAVLFIVGGFFEIRRFLRKMKKEQQQMESQSAVRDH